MSNKFKRRRSNPKSFPKRRLRMKLPKRDLNSQVLLRIFSRVNKRLMLKPTRTFQSSKKSSRRRLLSTKLRFLD